MHSQHMFCLLAIVLFACEQPPKPTEQTVEPIEVESSGSMVRGKFFRANGDGAHPTLLLVPGWPGSTVDVLGMGARIPKSGIQVVIFNPRGMHDSEGTCSFANTMEDIGVVFDWLRDPETAEVFGVDPDQICLGGHSFGGGMTMAYAAEDPAVKCLVSFAGSDHGVIAKKQEDEAFDKMIREMVASTLAPNGPVLADLESAFLEVATDRYNLQLQAPELSDRAILLIGGWEDVNTTMDDYMLPLYRALKTAGADDVTFQVYHDDHGFGNVREQMAEDVVAWMGERGK